MQAPSTPAELAQALRDAAAQKRTISLEGNASKRAMAGPREPADIEITTSGLRGVLQYEPHDLTISVEAGLPWYRFTTLLAEHRQIVPLDPPFAATATVGGVVAANCSGPRRRLYGTARDLVIGMTFATLEGKLVQSGGMVVKNVAGLDMAKLMIGSFGTLAAIAVVNFKLLPAPENEQSFLLPYPSATDAVAVRDRILASPLQPSAIDLVNPVAARSFGGGDWLLAVRMGGIPAAMRRGQAELAHIAGRLAVETECPATFWPEVRNFTPQFLDSHPEGAVVRVSCTLKDVPAVMESFAGPALARAASGVCYGYFEQAESTAAWFAGANRWNSVIEFAPEARKRTLELWPSPGGDLEIMRRVKALFDPSNLLNRGRLYRRI
ncbi:MAG TPA: FAD-binding protein [Bryobacteraceae bacterium]|nr:FAD-binding protein [Bryobacteraceae bacterium]